MANNCTNWECVKTEARLAELEFHRNHQPSSARVQRLIALGNSGLCPPQPDESMSAWLERLNRILLTAGGPL